MTRCDVRYLGAPESGVWAELIREDPTAVIFQSPEWLYCATRCGWRDASQWYETRDGRQLVLPLVVRHHRPPHASVLASMPPGWGTGGIVAARGVRPEEVQAVAAQLAGEFLQIRLRPSFLAAAVWEQASPLPGRSYPRRVHALDLRGGMDQVWQQRIGAKGRRGIRTGLRRAEQTGVSVQCGSTPELVSQFHELYLTWVAHRARARGIPTRLALLRAKRAEPRRTFEVVAANMGDRCQVRVASLEGRPVAATVTLMGDRTAIYWRGYDDREAAPTLHLPEMLQMAAIEEACERGCLDYEMGESGGVSSLERFKQKLGGEPRRIAEYRVERLPLSTLQDSFASVVGRLEALAINRGLGST